MKSMRTCFRFKSFTRSRKCECLVRQRERARFCSAPRFTHVRARSSFLSHGSFGEREDDFAVHAWLLVVARRRIGVRGRCRGEPATRNRKDSRSPKENWLCVPGISTFPLTLGDRQCCPWFRTS